ncbi:MAG: PAS domain S-box protein, partial [Dehalococcoidia bacterium]
RVSGYKPEEMTDAALFGLIHPDDVAEAARLFDQIVQDPGHILQTELRYRHKSGSWNYLEATGRNLLSDPLVEGIVVNFRDITERKQAEEELRIKGNALDNSIGAIAVSDMAGNITYLNRACARLWGSDTQEELLGKPYWELLELDNIDVAKKVATAMAEKGFWEGEVVAKRKDGKEVHVLVAAGLVNDAHGKPIQTLSSFMDVTERRQAEEGLRASEERFRHLVEEMDDGYMVIQGTTIAFVNASCGEMFGRSDQEMIGRSVHDFMPAKVLREILKARPKRRRGRSVPLHYETTLEHVDGTTRTVELGTNIITFSGAAALSVVMRDTTERKKAEEEKGRMEQQLLLSGRLVAVGELAAGVAHELNNPLAAVQAYSQFLTMRQDLDESIREDVETIHKEAQRASRITANLLSFARKHEPQKDLVLINKVIEDSVELNAYRLKVNNIEISTDLAPDVPETMVDFHQLQQVFVNLITNAEHAMTEAGGKGTLLIKTQRIGDSIQATFTDDGPGISEQNLVRIFDPFFTTKAVGEGTGLGLSICYGIIDQHEGRLYAKSKVGEGTTFTVELPVVTEVQASGEQAEPGRVEQKPTDRDRQAG